MNTVQARSGSDSDHNKDWVSSDCIGCHQTQTRAWQTSDHAKAMALPTKTSVLGDFKKATAEHYGQQAYFFIDNGLFKVRLTDPPKSSNESEGRTETFTIKYTFGHDPLQQYLVETRTGTLQVLPFAWDTRDKSLGGQRWYHNYENESVGSADRLHWRQPLQNWNGMCADCHSDELKRQYSPATNTFNTTYTGVNVGCVSCHGNMPEHNKQVTSVAGHTKPVDHNNLLLEESLNGKWVLLDKAKTAVWKGEARDNSFMDNCFACHALRAPMTDGFTADKAFLDQFSPNLIVPPLYHADGQIKEEVYVYGSFLQSKMYKAGVNCLDCHDPHTMKLKIENNGLCLQCHKASEFDVQAHHKHPKGSSGAQCVNCHMPDELYMVVDNRRDHSFKIPRPHLSEAFDTPNACSDCHSDKSVGWAKSAIESWYGKPKPMPLNTHNLLKLRHGQNIGVQAQLAIANDTSLNAIDRASAIEMLAIITNTLPANALSEFVDSAEPLIRLAAARVGHLVEQSQRANLFSNLISDDYQSVRVAAAQALLSIPPSSFSTSKDARAIFTQAFNELSQANEVAAWRGEGRVNQGNNALAKGDMVSAELAYKASIDIDPYFDAGYMNLADLYRAKQREDMVAKVLQSGSEHLPDSPDIAYAYGLHLVRLKKVGDSINFFKRALTLSPAHSQFAYTYVLALDGNNQTDFALSELKSLLPNYSDKQSLVELGLYLSQKLNDRTSYQWFASQAN